MIRLFLIRVLDTFFRAPLLYLMPVMLLGVYGIVNVVLEKPTYITATSIYIRPNQTVETLLHRQRNEENIYFSIAEITAGELNAYFQSEQFMNDVLARINLDDPAFAVSTMSDERKFMDYLSENTVAFAAGTFKVEVVVFNESPYLAEGIASEVFEVYLQRKIDRSMADSASTEAIVASLLNNYDRRIDSIEGELERYYLAHPFPETLGVNRRDIEEFQIERLTNALEIAKNRREAAILQLDSTDLIQFTTESVVRQTYLLLDAPFEPIKLTSRTAQLLGVIRLTAIGFAGGMVLLAAVALFSRRILMPIDMMNLTDAPVLAIVVADQTLKQPTIGQRLWARFTRRAVVSQRKPAHRTISPLPPRWRRGVKTAN